jgi:hypothetical protein
VIFTFLALPPFLWFIAAYKILLSPPQMNFLFNSGCWENRSQ